MGFLDEISRKITEGVDRARFEAEKFQRTTALQGELNDLRKQVDAKRMEFGDRAMELYRAGMIQSPTLGGILRDLEGLQRRLTLKEEELRMAQGQGFVEPPAGTPPAQSVPVTVEPPAAEQAPPPQAYSPPPPQPYTPPPTPAGGKSCPTCGFQLPATAVFCPNCGLRVA